jgi:hypothetical protein
MFKLSKKFNEIFMKENQESIRIFKNIKKKLHGTFKFN